MRGGGDEDLTVFLRPKGGVGWGGGRYSQPFLHVDLNRAYTVNPKNI